MRFLWLILLGLATLAACAAPPATERVMPAPADRIYRGGSVVTVDATDRVVAALAVRDGRIAAVGDEASVLALRGPDTEVVDLAGRALLPGFIDAHGHVNQVARFVAIANLASPPVGKVANVADLRDELRAHIERNDLSPGTWVIGGGYDDALLAEGRHPTRFDLDEVSTEHPILVLHVSMHLATANSAALAAAGIDASTADPPSGVFRRVAGSREPNGVMEEHAMFAVYAERPQPDPDQTLAMLIGAQQLYASHGFTTVQDGATGLYDFRSLQAANAQGRLFLDVVAYALWLEMDEVAEAAVAGVGRYDGHLKLGGVKMVLDGSPQGKTAWLSAPYHVPPPGRNADYVGYPAMSDDEAYGFASKVRRNGWPLLAHANGDQAAEQLVTTLERIAAEQGESDWRPVMIHAQALREDQLVRMAPLGVIPSFFVAHTFYWGDWHRDSVFGPERGARISPAVTAMQHGVRFTIHNDAPVVPPKSLFLLWTAVNRETRSGRVLGPDQRLTAGQALRAITIDAAFQAFEEDTKGSLEPGKRADLVILSASPLDVPAYAIRDIEVLETIKDGETVYRKPL
ncbi:MAG: amidohydrolase [Myxococcales bacterium]|nr:amidohydrolase [Myxococcales bacterium]